MPKSLYICYFGLREPLVQTQVIPYLKEILKDGVEMSLLTFEPEFKKTWASEQIETERKKLAEQNITWHVLPYHKRPSVPATFYDILSGARKVRKLLARENYDILHCRVHHPTLMAALARKFSRNKPKILFDIRGFFPEEYTDAGVWPEGGWLYRAVKRVESWLFTEADAFVVLTEKAKDIIYDKLHGKPIEVIPCCVDFDTRFSDNKTSAPDIDIDKRFVITHVGALGGLYLTDEIVDFLDAARIVKPDIFALFLTQTDPANVVKLLKSKGFTEHDYFVGKVASDKVPAYLSVANVGLSFVKATYATQSRSPTKIPEYLAAGLPLIANSGVGDVDKLIKENSVGVLIDKFERETYIDAVKKILAMNDISGYCRETARRCFDLETIGGERYRRLYKKMLAGGNVKENEQNIRPCPACLSNNAKTVGDKSGFEILVCRGCKTIYTSRVPAQNEVEDYDEYYNADNLSAPEFIRNRLEEIVGSFAPYRKSNRLLDVGFGSGTILNTARDLGWEISGQEVSKPAVEQARKLGFDVFHGELEDAKFPAEHFDVVTASEIIEHLPDPQRTLSEIARILRPEGLLWATTPSARSISFRLMKENWTVLSPPEHTQLYSKKGMRMMLAKAGFHEMKIQALGLNPSELISFYRAGNNTKQQFDRVTTGYELNEKMTSSTSGKLVKAAANVVLNTLQLGDSLKIYAQKAGA